MSGTVGPATAANSYGSYAGIGFTVNQDAGGTGTAGTVTPKGTGLTVTFTSSVPGVRVQLNGGGTSWCYNATSSPATIPYSAFNTKCFDVPVDGTAYAKQPISQIQIVVPGAATATAYNVSLTSLTENN
jgi:hypothetical protein